MVSRVQTVKKEHPLGLASGAHLSPHGRTEENCMRRKMHGVALDVNNLQMLDEKRDIFYLLSFILQSTKPVGHQVSCNDNFCRLQLVLVLVLFENWLPPFPLLWWLQDLVGLVISMLLLGDFSLVLLTLLQLYSISLVDVFLVLFILPLGILLPFPVGINALFSHGPRRSAGLARLYALWNLTSFINVVSFLSNFSWVVFFSPFCHTWIFPLIRMKYNDWFICFNLGFCVTFSITRRLHFYVDIFITTLNPLPAKDTQASSLGISCKCIPSFSKLMFIWEYLPSCLFFNWFGVQGWKWMVDFSSWTGFV